MSALRSADLATTFCANTEHVKRKESKRTQTANAAQIGPQHSTSAVSHLRDNSGLSIHPVSPNKASTADLRRQLADSAPFHRININGVAQRRRRSFDVPPCQQHHVCALEILRIYGVQDPHQSGDHEWRQHAHGIRPRVSRRKSVQRHDVFHSHAKLEEPVRLQSKWGKSAK